MAPAGFILLHRKIQENPLWTAEAFTKAQAWVDILLFASHADRRIIFETGAVDLAPGEMVCSQQGLARRWRWGREKVSNFLRLLRQEGMIDYKTRRGGNDRRGWTVISVLNWNAYQQPEKGRQTGLNSHSPSETQKAYIGKPTSKAVHKPFSAEEKNEHQASAIHRPGKYNNVKQLRQGDFLLSEEDLQAEQDCYEALSYPVT